MNYEHTLESTLHVDIGKGDRNLLAMSSNFESASRLANLFSGFCGDIENKLR